MNTIPDTSTNDQHLDGRHEPWCDLSQHIYEDNGSGVPAGCVSRAFEVSEDCGGWISGNDGKLTIVVDRPGQRFDGNYTPDQARKLLRESIELAAYLSRALGMLASSV